MSGGIALALLVIILVAAAVIGAIAYFGGGLLWFGKTSPRGDQVEGSDRNAAEREGPNVRFSDREREQIRRETAARHRREDR